MSTDTQKKTRVRPYADQVLVRPIQEADVTDGGIVLAPTRNKEKPTQGEVVEIGPGRLVDGVRVPVDLKRGEIVVFSKYAGTEISVDGVDHRLIRAETDVLAALEVIGE